MHSQPGHVVAVDYPARPAERLSPELRISQPGTYTLLNKGAFELCHCPDDLKHQPTRRRGQIQVIPQTHKSHTVRIEIGKRVDEVLERTSESVHLPAQHHIKAPQVNV